MNPLLPFVLIGLGFGFSNSEIDRFELAAAAEISSKLRGETRAVEVTVVSAGLATAWGELSSATITRVLIIQMATTRKLS